MSGSSHGDVTGVLEMPGMLLISLVTISNCSRRSVKFDRVEQRPSRVFNRFSDGRGWLGFQGVAGADEPPNWWRVGPNLPHG